MLAVRHSCSCCTLIASASAGAPRCDRVCLSCCCSTPVASASAGSPRYDHVCLSCCYCTVIASASALCSPMRLRLLLPDHIRYSCCSAPVTSASAAAPGLCLLAASAVSYDFASPLSMNTHTYIMTPIKHMDLNRKQSHY